MFRSYAGIPIVVTDELWAEMSGAAKAIYVALCRLSHRCSSLQVKADDVDLCKRAGIVPRTLFGARKELVTKGLVGYKRHVYDLCDKTPKSPNVAGPESKPITMRAEGIDLSDTDFAFGGNLLIPVEKPTSQPTPPTNDLDLSTVW